MSTERVVPHDASAEKAVLGAAMISAQAAAEVVGLLTPKDFYLPQNECIFTVIADLLEAGKPADVVAVADEVSRRGSEFLHRAGGVAYPHALVADVFTAANAGYYAGIVVEKAVRRRLIEAGIRITQMGFSTEGTLEGLVEQARSEIDVTVQEPQSTRLVADILPDVFARLRSKETFVPTPWPTLNAAIGGLRPGAVYVVAARPGVGKTVIASQLAAALAEWGFVAFSSLEMSEDELVSRLIADRLSIRVGKVKDNRLTDYDWQRLESGRADLEALRIAIDDRAAVSGVDVRSHVRAVSRLGRLAGVVVDYMQLMSSRNNLERHLQVSEFSRQLKIIAKDFHVPVVALSQLNRQSEQRADQKPRLSDLRESGAIEQDADVVILLRREEMPNHSPANPSETLWLDVAKNRHGETGEVPLWWRGEFSRAEEWPDGYESAFAGTF